jgi:hypothetical protein
VDWAPRLGRNACFRLVRVGGIFCRCAAAARCVISHWGARASALLVIWACRRRGSRCVGSDLDMFCIQASPREGWDHCLNRGYGNAAMFVNTTESLICCVILFD